MPDRVSIHVPYKHVLIEPFGVMGTVPDADRAYVRGGQLPTPLEGEGNSFLTSVYRVRAYQKDIDAGKIPTMVEPSVHDRAILDIDAVPVSGGRYDSQLVRAKFAEVQLAGASKELMVELVRFAERRSLSGADSVAIRAEYDLGARPTSVT